MKCNVNDFRKRCPLERPKKLLQGFNMNDADKKPQKDDADIRQGRL